MAEWSKALASKASGRIFRLVSSNLTLSAMKNKCGEMTEWTKVHDWKSCVPFKRGTEGSNPSLSAMKKVILGRTRWGGSGAL